MAGRFLMRDDDGNVCPDCTERAEVMWQASRGLLPISNDKLPRQFDAAKMRRA